ncbi:hypothetical protein B0H11DRAFT_355678 [Mycena galericulata]|nr:hypothetical protein B0H11DRAFT_355678 [Mycena galericulata]
MTRDTLRGPSYGVLTGLVYDITGKLKEQLVALLESTGNNMGGTAREEIGTLKRKRDSEDLEQGPALKEWANPTNFGQIPETVTGITAGLKQIQRIAAEYSETANATIAAVKNCVDEQTEVLMKGVQEAEKLKTENAQLTTNAEKAEAARASAEDELNKVEERCTTLTRQNSQLSRQLEEEKAAVEQLRARLATSEAQAKKFRDGVATWLAHAPTGIPADPGV